MALDERHRRYWRKTLTLTGLLLALWGSVSFGTAWFARELNDVGFLGPLGYYMGAQGCLIVYLAIIWYYGRRMDQLDSEYGVGENED